MWWLPRCLLVPSCCAVAVSAPPSPLLLQIPHGQWRNRTVLAATRLLTGENPILPANLWAEAEQSIGGANRLCNGRPTYVLIRRERPGGERTTAEGCNGRRGRTGRLRATQASLCARRLASDPPARRLVAAEVLATDVPDDGIVSHLEALRGDDCDVFNRIKAKFPHCASSLRASPPMAARFAARWTVESTARCSPMIGLSEERWQQCRQGRLSVELWVRPASASAVAVLCPPGGAYDAACGSPRRGRRSSARKARPANNRSTAATASTAPGVM